MTPGGEMSEMGEHDDQQRWGRLIRLSTRRRHPKGEPAAVAEDPTTMWDKPECPLSRAFLDDLRQIGSVRAAAPSVRVPWLLVHGSADDVVFPRDSESIHELAETRSKLVLQEGADHVFSGGAAATMAETVCDWLK